MASDQHDMGVIGAEACTGIRNLQEVSGSLYGSVNMKPMWVKRHVAVAVLLGAHWSQSRAAGWPTSYVWMEAAMVSVMFQLWWLLYIIPLVHFYFVKSFSFLWGGCNVNLVDLKWRKTLDISLRGIFSNIHLFIPKSLSLAFLLLLMLQIYCPILFLFNYLNKQGQNQRT